MSDYPADFRYTKEHEWIALEGDTATIGITDYAQGELGDIIYLELPEAGRTLAVGEPFGTVEAVKTVEEIYAPLAGEVLEVNGALEEQPELVNASPFGEGWLIKLKVADRGAFEALMDRESYLSLVGE